MTRQLRMVMPGGVYHLIARGNERKNIFRDDGDRQKLLKIVYSACERFDCRLYAYVLMSNHSHFVVKINGPNLSAFMHCLNGDYAIFFNRKHKRFGHLFQERFYSALVEHGPEIQRVVRYIHMNPVRAGMVDKLTDYAWFSHAQYEGALGMAWPEPVLKLFSDDRPEAIQKYREYMAESERLDWKKEAIGIYGDQILGNPDFIKKVRLMFKEKSLAIDIAKRMKLKKVYAVEDIIKGTAGFFDMERDTLLYKKSKWNRGKNTLIYLLSKDCGMSLMDISKLLKGLHYAGVSRTIGKMEKEIKSSVSVQKAVKKIRQTYEIKNLPEKLYKKEFVRYQVKA